MRQFKKILDKNDLKVNKYTMKGKAMIVDTPLGQHQEILNIFQN